MAAVTKTPQPPSDAPAIRMVTMPRDTNADGTIFGGVILSAIDQAGYVEAKRQADRWYVTVQMNAVTFKKPVYVGDVLALYAETTRIGRTSICINVRVMAERRAGHGDVVPVTEGEVVYVALDADGRPTEILPST